MMATLLVHFEVPGEGLVLSEPDNAVKFREIADHIIEACFPDSDYDINSEAMILLREAAELVVLTIMECK
jgi:hypothetical protein